MKSEVRTVHAGTVEKVKRERFAVEDAGVLSEKAEEDANEEAFQLVTGVAAGFKGIVEAAHDLHSLDVDGVLLLESMLLVAGDEGEVVNVFVQLAKWEFNGVDATIVEEREFALVFGLQIMESDAGEVGNDDVTWYFVHPPLADEVANVPEGLRLRLSEVFASAFVFDSNHAGPEEVDVTLIAGDLLDWLFECRYDATANAKDFEELVPKSLLLRLLALGACPFFGESYRAVADFIPGKRHAEMITRPQLL